MIKDGLYKLFGHKKALRIGMLSYVLYFFLYQWSIGYFKISTSSAFFKWTALPNWSTLLGKRISTFLFEGIGVLEFFGAFRMVIAPMNIIFALLLADLVFINIASVIYMMALPKQCRLDSKFNGLVGILPSFLTGFACCAPSFLIPLASLLGGATAVISQALVWLFPISVLILGYGAYSSLKKLSIAPTIS